MPDLPKLAAIGTTPTGGPWYDRLVGRLIRWGTATQDQYGKFHDAKVNHAVIFVGDVPGYDKPQLVQAQPHGAKFADWDSYGDSMYWDDDPEQLQLNETLRPLFLTDKDRTEIAAWARDCAIKKIGYNYLDFLAIGLAQKRFHKLINPARLRWWDRWVVNRLSRPDRLICSQLVDYAYAKASVHLFMDARPPGLVSPADLFSLSGT